MQYSKIPAGIVDLELFFREIHPKHPVFVWSWRDDEETDEDGPFGIAGDFNAQPSTAGVQFAGGTPPASDNNPASVIPFLASRRGLDELGHDSDASGRVTLPPPTSCLSNVTRLLVLQEPAVAAVAAATSVPS